MPRRLMLWARRVQLALEHHFRRFRFYIEVAEADEIARRYFVMNAFDGVLTILGIIVGSMMAGDASPKVILSAGVGASIAMAASGAWGAYVAERAERARALKDLERHIFMELEGSILHRASRAATIWVAVIDGLSPALAAFLSLLPVAMAYAGLIPTGTGLIASIALSLITLFSLGAFLGKISRESIWWHGVLMVGTGAVTALLLLLFLRL